MEEIEDVSDDDFLSDSEFDEEEEMEWFEVGIVIDVVCICMFFFMIVMVLVVFFIFFVIFRM